MIKKMLGLFLFLFLIIPFDVKATELVYDIENVSVTRDTMKIDGWAYVSGVNSIGGKTYEIYVAAVRASTYSNSSNVSNLSSSDKIVVKPSQYFGGEINGDLFDDMLYSTVCDRTKRVVNGVKEDQCLNSYYGYQEDRNLGIGNNLQDGLLPTSVTEGQCTANSSCMVNKPYFSVTFNLKELKNKFGTDTLTFVIGINYYEAKIYKSNQSISTNGSYCIYNGGYSCYTKGSVFVLEDFLTFSSSLIDGDEENVINGSDNSFVLKVDSYFEIIYNYTRIQGSNGLNFCASVGGNSDTYFKAGKRFKIKNVNKVASEDNGGLPFKYNINLYELELNFNCDGGIKDGSSGVYSSGYAWANWGKIGGQILIQFDKLEEEVPAVECFEVIDDEHCHENTYYAKCVVKETTDDYPIVGRGLNDSLCALRTPSVVAHKLYQKEENNRLYVTGGTDFSVERFPGEGFNINFAFERRISFDNYGPDPDKMYYTLKYWVWNKNLRKCEKVESDLTADSLKKRIGASYYNAFVVYAKSYFALNGDSTILTKLKNAIKDAFNKLDFGYSYPSVDTLGKKNINSNYLISSFEYVDVLKSLFDGQNVYGITYNISSNKAYIDANTGKVSYNRNSLSNPVDGGNKYFVPFDALQYTAKNNFKFITYINNASQIFDGVTLTSSCKLKVKPGKLDDSRYKYRVIDLSDPFPNEEPSSTHASNWLDLWNSNNAFSNGFNIDYLLDNKLEANVEKYVANLTLNNIKSIRDDNLESFDNLYINVIPRGRNSLFGVSGILSESNVSKYKVGTKEVAR